MGHFECEHTAVAITTVVCLIFYPFKLDSFNGDKAQFIEAIQGRADMKTGLFGLNQTACCKILFLDCIFNRRRYCFPPIFSYGM